MLWELVFFLAERFEARFSQVELQQSGGNERRNSHGRDKALSKGLFVPETSMHCPMLEH